DHARQISRHARRLQRLPYAGILLRDSRMSRFHGGSDVGFEIPGQVSLWAQSSHPTKRPASVVGPRTDRAGDTGWVTAGRPHPGADYALVALATLTADDAMAIAAFLQSLNPVRTRSATRFPNRSNPGKRFRPSCSGLCHRAKPQRLRPRKSGSDPNDTPHSFG